jgi:beta-galactosidase
MRHQNARLVNDSWLFYQGDVPPLAVKHVASDWQTVTLPHSWNAFDTMEVEPTRHYSRAIGWYAREFDPPPAGRRLWIEVEAASQRASIWCNRTHLGEHAGGYTAFTVELAPEQRGESLTLALQVDNLPDPNLIPSDLSDFFLYGGLTRNVWCYMTGPRRIATLRCETVMTEGRASLTAYGQLDAPPSSPLLVQATLVSPQGEPLTTLQSVVTHGGFALPTHQLEYPELWSPDHPALYTLSVALGDGNHIWDTVSERIGFRFFSFPAGGLFLLNGQPLRLHGTHRHEDWAGHGSAIPDELTRSEMLQIKQAGFNFVRLGHYPQAPAVLDACDELGLVVWEELPWCRGGVGGDFFRSQTRAMLEEMIEQHYNHPSIVLWGLGNELDWESEHPDSTPEQVSGFLQELHDLAHTRDPQRLTALRRFEPGARIVDVYSPSIWSGWYRGRYVDYEAALNEALARYPRMLHIEWGGDSHLGRHRISDHLGAEIARESDHAERPGIATSEDGPPRASRDGDWSESYILDLMEWHLQVQLRSPQLAGNAQWIFKDFGTPLRPENPIPYVNQKGLIDRAGHPKDVYYLFQSYLTTTPMCYIESPTWPVRSGKVGEIQRVRVYSNCPSVTLYVNGVSYGERQRDATAFPAAGLVWQVCFQLGLNELRAVGIAANGERVEHAITQEYIEAESGSGAAFRWQVQSVTTSAGKEARAVSLQLVDAAGNRVIDDRRGVTFSLQGAGQLCDGLGTVGGSRVIELANGYASIVVAEPDHQAVLLVSAPDIPSIVIPLIT